MCKTGARLCRDAPLKMPCSVFSRLHICSLIQTGYGRSQTKVTLFRLRNIVKSRNLVSKKDWRVP